MVFRKYNSMCERGIKLAVATYETMDCSAGMLRAVAPFVAWMRVKEARAMERGIVAGILADASLASPKSLANDLVLILGMQRMYIKGAPVLCRCCPLPPPPPQQK